MFHNLTISLVAHPEYCAVLLRINVENLPADSRIVLPWTVEAANVDPADCLPEAAKVLLPSSEVMRRKSVLEYNNQQLVVVDTTAVPGAYSPISVEETWGWAGHGTGTVEVILYGE